MCVCVCVKFLQLAGKTEVPARYSMLLAPAMNTMRGLLALASPVPGWCGSSHEDVVYVSDIRKSTLGDDIPKLGRLIIRKFNKSEKWESRRKEFEKSLGAEVSYGASLLGLTTTAQDITERMKSTDQLTEEAMESMEQEKLAMLASFVREITEWKQCFRPGAAQSCEHGV